MQDDNACAEREPGRDPAWGFLEFDLDAELATLRNEGGWQGGHTARTLAKCADLRLVLIALRAGARIPEHETRGRLALQTVVGHVRIHASGRAVDLPAGRMLMLEQHVPHDVEAVTDSGVLLTLAWPGDATAGG